MESNEHIEENVVSGPLKHLLSLEWETLPDISAVTKDVQRDIKPLKQVKKVRFSDEIEQTFLDSCGDEHSGDEHSGDELNVVDIGNEDKYDVSTFDENKLKYFSDDTHTDKSSLEERSHNKFLSDSDESEISCTNTELPIPFEEPTKEEVILDSSQEKYELSENYAEDKSFVLNVELEDHSNSVIKSKNMASMEKEINHDVHILDEIASIHIESNTTHPTDCDILSNEHCRSDNRRKNDNPKTAVTLSKDIKSDQNLSCQKQSGKINVLLNFDHKFSSVSEIKSTVISAWNEVKKTDMKNPKVQEVKEKHEKSNYSYKPMSKDAPTSKDAHTLWKRSKLRKRKSDSNKKAKHSLPFGAEQTVSKIDDEEREMAFKSWKKRKDEIIKQKAEREHRERQQHNLSLLMNKQIKKEDAESAFLAWKTHKAEINEKEKMKTAWFMQKERENNEKKVRKDKEALEMYYLWLESKYSQKKNYSSSAAYRPPWIPPGTTHFS